MGILQNKHLISLEYTPADDIQKLIDTGFTFREVRSSHKKGTFFNR